MGWVGKGSRLCGWAGEVGLFLPKDGGWVGGKGTIRGFWWTGGALQSFSLTSLIIFWL